MTDSWDTTLQHAARDTTGSFDEPAPKSSGFASLFDDPAGTLRDQATDRLRGFADTGKTQVTQTLDGVVHAAREIAERLQDGAFGPVGGIATQAADALEGWANSVKDKSVEDLLADGQALIRRSPGVAVGVAVAVGFAVSRIFKAGSASRAGR